MLNVLGSPVRILVPAAATGGAFSLILVEMPQGDGVPPHVHEHEEETFYVLESEVEFWCGGVTHLLRAGDVIVAPRGVPHSPFNRRPELARVLVTISPAGFEQFFVEADRLATLGQMNPERAMEVLAGYGCRFLPPPA